MNLIYEPTGKAKEYAPLALNIYKTCQHGCTYCYAPNVMHMTRKDFHMPDVILMKDNIFERLEKDLVSLQKKGNTEEVHMCFIGDLYYRDRGRAGAINAAGIASDIIKFFIKYDQPFTILTKGGLLAINDFPLLAAYDKCSFGVSMVWWNETSRMVYEPYASTLGERIQTLKIAKKLGIRTIVSLEPVIDPTEALQVIDHLHPYVDFWKIGKINHNKVLEDKIFWPDFVEDIKTKSIQLNLDYMLKESLKKYG